MNPALHISYDDLVMNVAARRNRINTNTGAHDFTTGEKVTLGILFSNAIKECWDRPRGKDWVWPFVVQSATLTVTSGIIALSAINYGPWVSLWSSDPRPASTSAYRIPVRTFDSSGVYPQDSLGSVFGLYVPRSPEFSNTAWAANTAFDSGKVVYYSTTGQCYRAKIDVPSTSIAITDATYWEEQLVPKNFNDYLVLMVQSVWLDSNGREESAAKHEADATEDLEREFVAAFRGSPSGSGTPWTTGGVWR